MSRFNSLEFGEQFDDQFPQQREPIKGEAFYLAEARSAFENANFEQGLRLYSKVLEFNPENASAWTGQVELLAAKAVALGRSGDLQGALAFSDASIEERGDTPYIWLARGDVLMAREETRADYCFEKALLLAPRDWFTTWLTARIRFYYHQFALALKLLQQAVEWNATHFLLWLELGRCQQAVGLVGLAQNSFLQAQQLNPSSEQATEALADLSTTWRRIFS